MELLRHVGASRRGWRRYLHPPKVRNSAGRRWFERRLATTPLEPYEPLVHLGTDYGGWVVPDDLIGADWLSYCVGAGSDVSFDLALIERYGCRVRAFDPLEVFRLQAEAKARGDPRFSFHEVAIAATDGPLAMYVAEDPRSGARSAANLFRTDHAVELRGRSLGSVMRELGDDRVDLLKFDIEGSEYDVLATLDLARLGVRVFCLELHHTRSVADARGLIGGLRAEGYLPVHRKPPTSFTFVRTAAARCSGRAP